MKPLYLLFISILSLANVKIYSLDYTYQGNSTYGYFGTASSGIGDFNGDGLDDFAVSNPGAGTGEVDVYYGTTSLSGPVLNLRIINSSGVNEDFGYSICGDFDFNDDGYRDIIIGSDNYAGKGRAYIFFGRCDAPAILYSANANMILNGFNSSDKFGFKVAKAGDVNEDNISDIMVSAPYYNNQTGRVYIYLGTKSPAVSPSPDVILTGSANSLFGFSIAAIGNIGGFSSDDIIVGATSNSNLVPGNAYIFYGGCPAISMDTSYDAVLSGDVSYLNAYGYSVCGLGDINGNGTRDFAVGDVYGQNTCSGIAYTGKIFIYDGGTGLPVISEIIGEVSTFAYDYFGATIDALGDIDGDGFSDFIVGSFNYDTQRGRTYLFKSTFASTPGICVLHTWPAVIKHCLGFDGSPQNIESYVFATGNSGTNDYVGASVSHAGDVNGDGTPDFLYGAVGVNNGAVVDAGQARLFISSPVVSTKSYGKLNLNLFVQGNIVSPCFQNPVKAQVCLYDAYCRLIDKKNILIGQNGDAIDGDGTFGIKFTNLFPSPCPYITYYNITIKPLCNSILTTSASVYVQIDRGNTATYDFTSASSQAYQNNQTTVGCHKFGIYSGDVDNNNIIDLNDVLLTFNDANVFASGGCCLKTNVNGDANVDLSDVLVCFNNAGAFISAAQVCGVYCF